MCQIEHAYFVVSEQVRAESWTDPLAAYEDSSSWCWVLVRPEASPPEQAVPGFRYNLHPAGGDSVRQRGLCRRKRQTWVFSYMTHFLTSSIRSLALPISSGMDTSLLLLTRRTLRGRLNKYFGKTDSRFRLWRKIKHWPTLQRHDWTCTSEYVITENRVSANGEMCVMLRFSVFGTKWGTKHFLPTSWISTKTQRSWTESMHSAMAHLMSRYVSICRLMMASGMHLMQLW